MMTTISMHEEQESLEETLVDEATASLSISELEAEIQILDGPRKAGQGGRCLGTGPKMGRAFEDSPE